MLNSLPPVARDMRQTQEMLLAMMPETALLRETAQGFAREFCAKTANEALSRFERDLGITPSGGLSAAQRRERVTAALLSGTVCTPAHLKEVIERVAGVTVNIIEHPEDYAVEIAFADVYGTPRYLDDLKAAVRKILPAHITDIYTFLYKLVQDYYEYTLSGLSESTLSELEV